MSRRLSVIPQHLRDHRLNISAVDTPIPPLEANVDWDSSEGYPLVRFYFDLTFVGGTSPSLDIGIYVRQLDSGAPNTRRVARSPAPDDRWTTGTINIAGDDVVAFDALVEGDDYLVVVEAVNGTPTSFNLDVRASGR